MNVDRLAARTSAAIVTAAVVAGLVVSGSPLEQRLVRRDGQRVGDLQTLTDAVERYRERHDGLPADLPSLVDGRLLSRLPSDPDGRAYGYEALDADRYALCARFDRASADESAESFWRHPQGEHCFSFAVTEAASER